MAGSAPEDPGLTDDELRAVTRYVLGSAEEVLGVFEAAHGDDDRPRAAVRAARLFVEGAPRTRLQRVTSLAAHRAGREAGSEIARCAARAAGDAASAPYLHPPAQVMGWASRAAREGQVGHVLRAAAHVARVHELTAGDDPGVGERCLDEAFRRASPVVADVVRRYPAAPAGRNRVARLTALLDARFRE